MEPEKAFAHTQAPPKPRKPATQRRSRVPLSCDPCRARKLKCNREQPCQNCTARDEQAACAFQGPKAHVASRNANGGDSVRHRINHLEQLVTKLIAERQNSSSSNIQVQVQTPESPRLETDQSSLSSDHSGAGKTFVDGGHSAYFDRDDWYVVLQEINELKKSWSQDHDQQSYQDIHSSLSFTIDGSGLLFSQVKPMERIEIISSLPPKWEVDRLISTFFNYDDFPINLPPIIHAPSFMREYEEHWKNPSKTSMIWLGLLFSMLGMTMLAYHQYDEPQEYEGKSESLFQLYRARTAQCLLSGDIAKCLPYTVETLRLNAAAELNRKDDNRRGLWIMTGVVVRTAINMGYHQDPSQTPGISVLQAEYRRRVWLSVISLDEMASFLGGFPRTTSPIYSNTKEPRNLHDWELSEDPACTELPCSRPLTEKTATTYLIVKSRLFQALGRVADLNSNLNGGSYESVLEIDKALCEAYERIPAYFKVGATISDGNSSPGSLENYSSLSLLAMYHQGMCVLHRKYLVKDRSDIRFKFSRDRCISSALATLAYQKYLDWSFYKMSQARQVLTLASMILCLELELRRKTDDLGVAATPDSHVLLQALQEACVHWSKAITVCDEVSNIHRFLTGILSSFQAQTAAASTPLQDDPSTTLSEMSLLNYQSRAKNEQHHLVQAMINDFDWATWDAFIEDVEPETGPIY